MYHPHRYYSDKNIYAASDAAGLAITGREGAGNASTSASGRLRFAVNTMRIIAINPAMPNRIRQSGNANARNSCRNCAGVRSVRKAS